MGKLKNYLIRTVSAIALTTVVLSSELETVIFADTPYETYSYDWWGEDIKQPAAYTYSGAYSLTDTPLNDARDMFVQDGKIYIADTGNSRIVILNEDGTVFKIITSFQNGGKEDTFSGPQGLIHH